MYPVATQDSADLLKAWLRILWLFVLLTAKSLSRPKLFRRGPLHPHPVLHLHPYGLRLPVVPAARGLGIRNDARKKTRSYYLPSCSAWVLVGRMGCSSVLCRIAISSYRGQVMKMPWTESSCPSARSRREVLSVSISCGLLLSPPQRMTESLTLNFSRLCSGSLLTTISSTCWKLSSVSGTAAPLCQNTLNTCREESEPESFWSPSLKAADSPIRCE